MNQAAVAMIEIGTHANYTDEETKTRLLGYVKEKLSDIDGFVYCIVMKRDSRDPDEEELSRIYNLESFRNIALLSERFVPSVHIGMENFALCNGYYKPCRITNINHQGNVATVEFRLHL